MGDGTAPDVSSTMRAATPSRRRITPLGRQEALRRMATRLRQQGQPPAAIASPLAPARAALETAGLPAPATPVGQPRTAGGCASAEVLFGTKKALRPGHVRGRIAAALDHMGITDPAARRNWIGGYETLIARESGGRHRRRDEPATVSGVKPTAAAWASPTASLRRFRRLSRATTNQAPRQTSTTRSPTSALR